LINPYDIVGLAEAIHTALIMPQKERTRRMRRMRREVQNANIFYWVENFLSTAISKVLKDFPNINEYIPSE
jgi:trehalose-6-phosphate synthase